MLAAAPRTSPRLPITASYYGCHFLLTWNCVHLANANKFAHIHHVNHLLGLMTPVLTTPLELLNLIPPS